MMDRNAGRRSSPVRFFSTYLHLWPLLRVGAILAMALVCFTIVVDAYAVNKAFVWISDAVLSLSWDEPSQTIDHYRLEVAETDLLAEPVTTSLMYAYTKRNGLSYELKPDRSYLFRVQSINPYGVMSDYSDSTALYIREGGEVAKMTEEAQPVAFALSQNYPNPFNSRTTINYQVPGPGAVVETTMTIYNITGQKIRELVHEHAVPGQYSVVWDGLDSSGNQVSSGHYIYLLTAGTCRMTKKMIFMK